MRIYTDPENKTIPPHKWFAWFPVWATFEKKANSRGSLVWLEYVERWKWGESRWQYILIKKNEPGIKSSDKLSESKK